jgi:hypothetical protein
LSNLTAFFSASPDWLLPLGWLVLLLGWVLGRPATQRFVNKVSVIGFGNTTTNTVNQTSTTPSAGGTSTSLTNASSVATILGLLITLWPVVKPWLNLGT